MERNVPRNELPHGVLTGRIIGCAMRVHRTLGSGFLESVYERALLHELEKVNLRVECQRAVHVYYDGVVVGKYAADMVVEDRVIVENKAVLSLLPAHEAQLVHYLTAIDLDLGLLLNFGSTSLQFKRKHRILQVKKE